MLFHTSKDLLPCTQSRPCGFIISDDQVCGLKKKKLVTSLKLFTLLFITPYLNAEVYTVRLQHVA